MGISFGPTEEAQNRNVLNSEEIGSLEEAKKDLTPEEKVALLTSLKMRFVKNEKLHEGIEWKLVELSLEADQDALWSINEMEKANHEPDLYNVDFKGFDYGTCSQESPDNQRNLTYPEIREKSQKMGIKVMKSKLYINVLQTKGEFDIKSWSWVKTPKDILRSNGAFRCNRDCAVIGAVREHNADYRGDETGWRGTKRIQWVNES